MRKSFYKSLLNSACLWNRAGIAVNIKQNYFLLPDLQFAEIWVLFLAYMKGQKRDDSRLVTKFVGIIVTIVFI